MNSYSKREKTKTKTKGGERRRGGRKGKEGEKKERKKEGQLCKIALIF